MMEAQESQVPGLLQLLQAMLAPCLWPLESALLWALTLSLLLVKTRGCLGLMLTRTLSCLGVPCLAASFLLHPSLPFCCVRFQRHGFPGVDVHVFEGHYSTGLGVVWFFCERVFR